MRQRILVILALIAALVGGLTIILRFGHGVVPLRLMRLSNIYRAYDYLQYVELSDSVDEVRSIRQYKCNLILTDREAEGGGNFRATMAPLDYQAFVDGIPVEHAVPNLYQNLPQDSCGRTLLNQRPDLYDFDMLNGPTFFPLLTNRPTKPGDEWEYQFRIILPDGKQQMIVAVRSRLADYSFVGIERLARIDYTARGEAYYRTPDTHTAEKATLTIQGESLWNPVFGVPHSLEHKMVLRTQDYDQIRNLGSSPMAETAATRSLRQVKVRMNLTSNSKPLRATPSRGSPTPASTPLPESKDEFY